MGTIDSTSKGNPCTQPATADVILEAAGKIKLLILDVDGVLTDGGIILDNEGNELKSFHVRDGHGIKLLIRKGVDVAIITGRHSRVVERRAHELGVKEIHQKCFNKVIAYEQIKGKFALQDEEVAYIGDDVVDIPLLRRVGLPVTVADASEDVRAFSMIVTGNRGGRGAVREITDLILKAKGFWEGIINGYIKT
ncbi:3-deoxy-D-manno-octulosonate 8-phosphate phosphatase KdsC [bacterium BMS3Bbin07]|nr:3-deoxy-D-manno-octulosonate 8-phosphate phosphatase KdsC [bacterium BMS3Bbin07]HDH02555.1 HAD-IIIA family hydrolase [Nitrospirota bacterium]